MNFKVNRDYLTTSQVVYEDSAEQSVEMDYILPDYLPEIFKIMKCFLEPKIVSKNVNGDKLTLEIAVDVKVLYLTQDSNKLYCIDQKQNYTKNIDIGTSPNSPEITASLNTEYVNCRAVNARRLDVRGAVSIKAKVVSQVKNETIIDAYGSGIQLKKSKITYPAKKLMASKTVTLTETIDLSQTKPPIATIIKDDVVINQGDHKVVSDKLVVKGRSVASILYTTKDEEEGLQTMEFEIPYSQILDVKGINDSFENYIEVSYISSIFTPNEEGTSFDCEIVIRIDCVSVKYEEMDVVTDIYSTKYPFSYTNMARKIDKTPKVEVIPHSEKSVLEYKDGEIMRVYHHFSKIGRISQRFDNEKDCYVVTCKLISTVICKNENNCPIYLEGEVIFEKEIPKEENQGEMTVRGKITDCSYNLISTNSVEVKTDLELICTFCDSYQENFITEIEMDNNEVEKDDFAVKLYFATSGESVWEIAKKLGASANEVMRENDLLVDEINENVMLLIPIN